jgi:hypothetical protein
LSLPGFLDGLGSTFTPGGRYGFKGLTGFKGFKGLYRRLNQFIRGVESVNKPSASEDDYEVDDATNNLTFVGDPDTVGSSITAS